MGSPGMGGRAATLAVALMLTLEAEACQAGERSPGAAFLLSLLLPGAGHLYAGSTSTAKAFFVVEGALWSTFGGFKARQAFKEDDLELVARVHARVDIDGRSDAFLDRVETYGASTEYNRRTVHESGREAVLHTGPDAWRWDSPGARRRFTHIRDERLSAHNASTLVLGVLVVSRLVAGITAVRAVRRVGDERVKLLPRRDGLAVVWRLR